MVRIHGSIAPMRTRTFDSFIPGLESERAYLTMNVNVNVPAPVAGAHK